MKRAKTRKRATTKPAISLRALARRIGVSPEAVSKGRRTGRLSRSIGTTKKGQPVVMDPDLAVREWHENATKPSPRGSTVALADEQRLLVAARRRKLELETMVAEGRLIDRNVVVKEAFEAERIVREAMLNLPARLAGELAAESDPGRVHLRLDAAIRDALTTAADALVATVNA